MRKVLVLLLAILMVFALVACKQEPEQAEAGNVSMDEGKDNLIAQGAKGGSKAIDGKGFRVTGTYEVAGSKVSIEIGGKDGIYWIGTDDNLSDGVIDAWVFFSEVDNGNGTFTLKLYDSDLAVWDSYTQDSSLKDAIFGTLADTILFCSFNLSESFPGFTAAVAAGADTKDSRPCTKYTASFSADLPESMTSSKTKKVSIYDATLFVDNEFAVTLEMSLSISKDFKDYVKQVYAVDSDDYVKQLIDTMDFFKYKATVDFDLSDSDLAKVTGYAAAAAAL